MSVQGENALHPEPAVGGVVRAMQRTTHSGEHHARRVELEPEIAEPEFDNIPAALIAQPWAVWNAEPPGDRPGKFNKAPRCPKSGRKIGADKPHLFDTFAEARAAFEGGNCTLSRAYSFGRWRPPR
jgi:hypothetical protein